MVEEEDNPFLLKRPDNRINEPKTEEFGTSEIVSFMISPSDVKTREETREDTVVEGGPHWEDAGTPVWDRGVNTFELTRDEVVDHEKKKKVEP